jgi:hypothetical protein
MKKITVEYTPQFNDHIEAYRKYEKSTALRKTDIIAAAVSTACGLFFLVYTFYAGKIEVYTILAIIFLLYGINELTGALSIAKFLFGIRLKMDPRFRDMIKITFSDKGINYKTPSIDSDIKWDFYKKLVESDNTLILVYGKRQYSVIPKSVFSKKDLGSVIDLLSSNLETAG